MAKMIPPYINSEVISNAERRLFTIIKNDKKMKNWICLHSLGLSQHKTQSEGEIDFVLMSKYGIFVLEVKGGRVKRNNGYWEFKDRYGQVHKKFKGPFRQVKDNLYSLRDSLLSEFGNEINQVLFGYGVLFPDIHFEIKSTEWDDEIIYDISDRLKKFSSYLERLTKFWRGKFSRKNIINDYNIQRYLKYLRGDFEIIQSLDNNIDLIEDDIVSLTNDQYKALDRMDSNQRVLYQGTAGTGKTLLAIENAKRKALNDKKVLFLCFNRNLASFIRGILNKNDYFGNITVDSLHRFMHKYITKFFSYKNLEFVYANHSDQELYKEVYPELFIEAIEFSGFKKFDYLIIDEGQDILCFEYLIVFDYLIKGGLEYGKWSFFYDSNRQSGLYNLYSNELINNLKQFGAAEYKLDINCRNTKQIAIQTSIMTKFKLEKNYIEGEKVKIKWFSNDLELFKKVKESLSNLTKKGINNSDITILYPKDEKKYFIELKRINKNIEKINSENLLNLNKNKIYCSTTQGYKGLENSIVLYIGINDIKEKWYRTVNYIGMSRAKEVLYLFVNENLKEEYFTNLLEFSQTKNDKEDVE